jgi:hypothetical protein
MFRLSPLGCALLSAFFTLPAFAHITLEQSEAPIGAHYKAVFRMPHGCDERTGTVMIKALPLHTQQMILIGGYLQNSCRERDTFCHARVGQSSAEMLQRTHYERFSMRRLTPQVDLSQAGEFALWYRTV